MTKAKRRLIFAWPYLEWGGSQIVFLALMKDAKAAWEVTAILPRLSDPVMITYLQDLGVEYRFIDAHLYPASNPARSLWQKAVRQYRRVSAEIAMFRALKDFDLKESVLHLDVPPWQSWQVLTVLSLQGANVFVSIHNAPTASTATRRKIWQMRMRFLSRLRGFHILTSNKDTKERIRDLVVPSFWDHIPIAYTSIDPVEIEGAIKNGASRSALRERHGIEQDAFVGLCVGQFIDRKGRWTLMDAATKLPHAKFVWLTPKAPPDDDLARIESYDLGDRFRLVLSDTVGSKREDILAFFRIADVFVLPSFVEGLPGALLEAMAMGLPSIATRVYAIPEAVKDKETGLLVPAGDSQQLAQAILDLRMDQDLRERLASNGQTFVLENFDQRAASQTALASYEECFKDG
jgi:glycosyltransferase involved in cell wall biosynthesis